MNPEEWSRLEAILDAALERPPEDRTAFIEEACGEDAALLAAARRVPRRWNPPPGSWSVRCGSTRPDLMDGCLEEEEDAAPVLPVETIGPYRLIREIGRGGMGAVYLAERSDGQYEKKVAIKLVPPGPDAARLGRRFAAERRILASLEHPHIATPARRRGQRPGAPLPGDGIRRGRADRRLVRRAPAHRRANGSRSVTTWPRQCSSPTSISSSIATSSPATSSSPPTGR